ncbi:MAG: LysE family translocator [Actinobacteria bacterium]|nr:LysE family translocator [Actinomycetota bacterium]MBU1494189.1 LysE family translocator [Actinomycetota bacterium]MBU1865642.1 LysE family translocator [Actinomycetota bacterium]
MPEASTMLAFSAAALLLFVVPGPAVLYIVTRGMAQGRRAGLVSVAGIHTGSLVHIAAAVAGLTTLLATSAVAFRAVKWAGAAYLVLLGIRAFLDRDHATVGPAPSAVPMRRIYVQGFVVTLLNPKVALFFLAFVPQFIDPAVGTAGQVLALGGIFLVIGVVMDGLYALASGSIGNRLHERSWWRTGRRWVSGSIYVALGVVAAATGHGRSA